MPIWRERRSTKKYKRKTRSIGRVEDIASTKSHIDRNEGNQRTPGFRGNKIELLLDCHGDQEAYKE